MLGNSRRASHLFDNRVKFAARRGWVFQMMPQEDPAHPPDSTISVKFGPARWPRLQEAQATVKFFRVSISHSRKRRRKIVFSPLIVLVAF
ncbi:hypothetical protein AVEN_142456-1 [Araneus ventricosus]|uniref:Uncharacterized protein n=1 Tax=Araneus ventricosus TaxID=182803 RepID=A0A4Y2LKD2_ARAVE|nr:hypothetical protein AVEN_142456-1 [Araneus ventricosus]